MHETELNDGSPTKTPLLSVEVETRAHSAPPAPLLSSPSLASPPLYASPPPSQRVIVTACVTAVVTPSCESCVTLDDSTSAASYVTLVSPPEVSLRAAPAVITDVMSDVLVVVAPEHTLDVTPDVTAPVELPVDTCITIEQTQQDSPVNVYWNSRI